MSCDAFMAVRFSVITGDARLRDLFAMKLLRF